jgi:DME family drug/metabolite transporter
MGARVTTEMSLFSALRAREGLLAVSAGAVLWGTNGVLVHFISDHRHLGAVSIGFYRLVFSSAVLIAIAGLSSLRVWRAVTAGQRWLLLLSGVLLGAYQGLYFAAIGAVGVSVSTLVSLGVAPLAITAVQSAGSRTLVSARLHPVAGPLTLTTVASVVGAVTLLPLALVAGLGFSVDAATLGGLGYMGIIATALAYGLFFHGLRSTPSEVASVLTLLEPLAATLLAVALIHERLPPAGILGGCLMLIAIGVLYAAPASHPSPTASRPSQPIAPEVTLAAGGPGGGEPARTATMDE